MSSQVYVYTSKEGQKRIEEAYRVHLRSDLAAGLKQKTVNTPFGKTFLLEKSAPEKPPLILLHGSVSNSASWLGLIPEFAPYFSLYCLDIPGEPGLSTAERLSLKSDSPQKWLESVLDELGLEKASFLGMSLGGWYALNFAIARPARVSALSLFSTGGIGRQKTSFIFKALFFLLLGSFGQNLLNKAIYHKAPRNSEILEYQALVSKYFRPVAEPLPLFSDDALLDVKSPLQYIGGDRDVLLDTKEAVYRLSKLLPQADARLLSDTGHVIVDKFGEARDFIIQALERN